jgi:hypothetical protein
MNYAELCAAVEATVENTFTAADLARFARLTEQAAYNVTQPPAIRKVATVPLVASTPTASVPADFLFPYSVSLVDGGVREPLLNKDYNYLVQAFPDPLEVGSPRIYSILDDSNLIFAPVPDLAYSVEIAYAAYPESIVTAGTTWLGDNFDSVLLNGMLMEAARFLRLEQDTVALYDKMFNQSMTLLKMLGDGKLRQDTYRSGQVRVPVQ